MNQPNASDYPEHYTSYLPPDRTKPWLIDGRLYWADYIDWDTCGSD